MKLIYKQIMTAVMMGFVLPWMILGLVSGIMSRRNSVQNPDPGYTDYQETEVISHETGMNLNVVTSEGAVPMALEYYVTGVVLAEMPAQFESEALKAQAVVARTYALRRMQQGRKHSNGDVCTDPNCCQGYRSAEEYITRGGSEENVEKIEEAVKATAGQVLTYEGALIEATYFSCSGGQTEDALAVWGSDIPYLQSTDSPGEENAAHYRDTVTMTPEEFRACVDRKLPSNPSDWFGNVTYTKGGGVASIQIGDKTYNGTEVRNMLSLRSTDFTIRYTGNVIEIITKGFGHRVGMSQYGADAMAVSGRTYDEILAHYYQGTLLQDYRALGN